MTAAAVPNLDVLSAGAAKGLVEALAAHWRGPSSQARFGAVGAMRQALRDGHPCDVLILTDAMLVELDASGDVAPGSRRPIGRVATGVAVASGVPAAARANPVDGPALKACLVGASAVYVPDVEKSTAGAHVRAVLRRLGIDDAIAPRLRMFDSGAVAMRALADSGDLRAIGCTQATEIVYTPGVDWIAPLPEGYALETVYSAAVATRAADVAGAQRLIDALTGPLSRALRVAGGFAPV